MEYIWGVIIGTVFLTVLYNFIFKHVIIYEYERGLKYFNGRYVGLLEPGKQRFLSFNTSITKIDMRPRIVTISGQEIISSDGVSVKVSLIANYEIEDADLAINKVQDFRESVYAVLQLALREIIGGVEIDTLLGERNNLFLGLADKCRDKVKQYGVNLLDCEVKDLMFPGALREMFAQVTKARREGQAALERARSETASLRSLANAAKMLESNPYLMNLRVLQTFAQSSGNTMVFTAADSQGLMPIRES